MIEAPSCSGGFHNTASGDLSSISGGAFNTASGPTSSVSGGHGNTASGHEGSNEMDPPLCRLAFMGSVATFAQEAMKGQLSLSVRGLRGQSIEQFGRSEVLFSCLYDQLFFLNHVHEFDPDQGILGGVERFKPQHRLCHTLYFSMILFHHII
jgi:hypothetical protein